MKRFQRLARLSEYINNFKTPESGLKALVSTAASDATSMMTHSSDFQVVVARPEERQDGGIDNFTSSISTAFFIVCPKLGAVSTPEREAAQYSRALEIADEIVGKISDDISAGNCNLLSGLSISSVDIVPEASIFGGWMGYSVEISFD